MDKRIFTQQGPWLGFALLLFVIVDTWVLGRFYLALQGLEVSVNHLEWFALIFAVHMAGISLPALQKEYESKAFAWIIGIMNLAAMCYFFEWLPGSAFELRTDGSKRFLSTAEKWADWLPKGLASAVWATFVGYGYLQLPTAFTQAMRERVKREPVHSPKPTPAKRKITHVMKAATPPAAPSPDWVSDEVWGKWVKGQGAALIEKIQSYSEQQAKDRRKYLRRKLRKGSINGERPELEALEVMICPPSYNS